MEDSAEIQKSRFLSSGCYLVGWVEQLRSTSFRTRPGTLSGKRKALTRTELSTTALSGIRFALLIDDREDLRFLCRARLPTRSADRPEHDCAACGHFRLQVVAFLEAGGFSNAAR